MSEAESRGVKGVRQVRRVEKRVEAEGDEWGQVMKRLEDLEKKMEDGFKRMDEQIGRVMQQKTIEVVKEAADPSFGWGYKDT